MTCSSRAPASDSTRCTNRVEPDRHRRLVDDDRAGRRTGAISRATASTNDRSAAPSSPCGVCTQRNTISASRGRRRRRRPRTAGASTRRPSATSSGRPSSRIGTSPLRQAGDPLRVDVGADDVVAEVREARGRRQPDVAGAHDRDSHEAALPWLRTTGKVRGTAARIRYGRRRSPQPREAVPAHRRLPGLAGAPVPSSASSVRPGSARWSAARSSAPSPARSHARARRHVDPRHGVDRDHFAAPPRYAAPAALPSSHPTRTRTSVTS